MDVLTFGLQITPVGSAPPLSGSLTFAKDNSITDAPFVSTAGTTNAISVVWSTLSTALSGTRLVGVVSGTVPAGALKGQSYAITITGADGGFNGGEIHVSAGPSATLAVAASYMAGDVYPYASDTALDFGDQTLDIRDLIQELFAVTNVPGFRPAACSDRFDAMDVYPVDTDTARGGDGNLDIRDLVRELFRVTQLDPARPLRTSLGGVCAGTTQAMPSTATAQETARRLTVDLDGALTLGSPEAVSAGVERIAVYLEARRPLSRVAVAFALGDRESALRFVSAGIAPSLVSSSERGLVAAAWTEGMSAAAGERVLLGYIDGPAAANWKVYGVSASQLDDDREVRISAPAGTGLE